MRSWIRQAPGNAPNHSGETWTSKLVIWSASPSKQALTTSAMDNDNEALADLSRGDGLNNVGTVPFLRSQSKSASKAMVKPRLSTTMAAVEVS